MYFKNSDLFINHHSIKYINQSSFLWNLDLFEGMQIYAHIG